jgi:oligosaccharide repeat unit polymerase
MITVWAGLRLAKLWARGEPRPVAIVFWLYVYVWLGLAGLLQLIHQTAPWPIIISSAATWRGQIIIAVGLTFIEVGHLFPSRRTTQIDNGRQIIGWRVTVLVVLVLLAAPIWYHFLGGFHALFSSREELSTSIFGKGAHTSLASGGIKSTLATVPTFLALYAALITQRYRLWPRLVMGLLIFVVVILNSPISMPRFWTGTILVALIFSVPVVQHRAAAMRIVIAGMIFTCIVLFPYAAYFRYSSGFIQPPGVVQTLTTKGDYDSFEMVTTGVQYASEDGFRYGRQALGDLLFFVPRSVWPSKAQDTGEFLAEHYRLTTTNLSAPLWIESYIDFGYFGVIVLFFLYGLLMRRADDRFVKGNSPFMRFVIPLLAGYSCILLRGSLLQAMARLAIMLIILWLISSRRGQRPAWIKLSPLAEGFGDGGV